jgi:hypothetical protein
MFLTTYTEKGVARGLHHVAKGQRAAPHLGKIREKYMHLGTCSYMIPMFDSDKSIPASRLRIAAHCSLTSARGYVSRLTASALQGFVRFVM